MQKDFLLASRLLLSASSAMIAQTPLQIFHAPKYCFISCTLRGFNLQAVKPAGMGMRIMAYLGLLALLDEIWQ